MNFEILRDHSNVDVDEWASIECPLQHGIHCIHHDANDEIFDNPQWVVARQEKGEWFGALADNEGEAFDLLLTANLENLDKLEEREGVKRLNLL